MHTGRRCSPGDIMTRFPPGRFHDGARHRPSYSVPSASWIIEACSTSGSTSGLLPGRCST